MLCYYIVVKHVHVHVCGLWVLLYQWVVDFLTYLLIPGIFLHVQQQVALT